MISQIQVAEYYGLTQFDSLLREMLLGGIIFRCFEISTHCTYIVYNKAQFPISFPLSEK